MLDFSCILINYNSSNYTLACVKSIQKHVGNSYDFEIIIADNASKLEDYEHLKQELKQLGYNNVFLHRSKINTGFGAGNMFGYQFAKDSNYVAFINNDVEIESNIFLDLVAYLDNHYSVGVCSPQMLNGNKEFVPTVSAFPSAAKEIFGRRLLEKLYPKSYTKRKAKYSKPTQVDFVIGSFMFFRTTDFDAIGGFDTNLFLYYEEADVCFKLKKNNKSTYLLPQITYIHHISKSTGSNKNLPIVNEHFLSLMYVLKKHRGVLSFLVVLNFLRMKYLLKSIVKPSKFKIFKLLISKMHLSKSLKQQQLIYEN